VIGYIISMLLSPASVVATFLGIVQANALLQFAGITMLVTDVGILVLYLIRIQNGAPVPSTVASSLIEVREEPVTEETSPVLALANRVVEILRRGADVQVDVETMVRDRCILQIQTASGEQHIGIVQHTSNSVSLADVRGLYSLILNSKSQRGVFFTNGTFSTQAVRWAEGKPVHLINGYGLAQLTAKYDIK
jgi:hypothetical protein